MKVYVLIDSWYEDLRIKGIISDKGLAERYAEGRGCSYEEIEVDGCLAELQYLRKEDNQDDIPL